MITDFFYSAARGLRRFRLVHASGPRSAASGRQRLLRRRVPKNPVRRRLVEVRKLHQDVRY